MIEKVFEFIAALIINVISSMDYLGIILLMAIESACIPLPSEIIIPFAGYLVQQKVFTLSKVTFAGAFGCVVGSIAAYYIGKWGGRPFVERYGRYILISKNDLNRADEWFNKYGDISIFFSRLLPIIRTFIALPAGIARMNFLKFVVYTFLGSLPWCFGLAYIGFIMGGHWKDIRVYFHKFDFLIGGIILLLFIWYVWRHIKTIDQ